MPDSSSAPSNYQYTYMYMYIRLDENNVLTNSTLLSVHKLHKCGKYNKIEIILILYKKLTFL